MKKTITTLLISLLVAVTAMADTFIETKEKAILGDKDAMYQLSKFYMDGTGVAPDYDRSDYWLERAAQEGQQNAKNVLNSMGGRTGLTQVKRHQFALEERIENERLRKEQKIKEEEQKIIEEEQRKKQEEEHKKKQAAQSNEIHNIAAYMPSFPEGEDSLKSFISNNLKYPQNAIIKEIEGRVVVQFVVEKDGSIGEMKVAKGVDKDLDNEAIRVCKLLPKFTPGLNSDNDTVRVWYTLPITFKLPETIVEIPRTDEYGNLTFTINNVSFTMMKVKGGSFIMGASSEQGNDALPDEKPIHNVTLSSYYIGQTEVTQELWIAIMGENPSWFNSYGNSKFGSGHSENYGNNLKRPVERVSWDDCQEFIRRLNSKTGRSFRLPTEAEWEYAARGGSKSKHYKYSGSNLIDDVAVYIENSYNNGKSSSFYGPQSVASKKANELGLYDMSGNVWEWCSDWSGKYNNLPQSNPQGPNAGSKRVLRGGSWDFESRNCRVSYRIEMTPNFRNDFLGLRLAL